MVEQEDRLVGVDDKPYGFITQLSNVAATPRWRFKAREIAHRTGISHAR